MKIKVSNFCWNRYAFRFYCYFCDCRILKFHSLCQHL
nr:MAG TPA: coiled coil protein [Caudoviricetes sp.]DAS82073.1 MAG TPA: coiled coil protein [Caudoviricetes sp.]